MCRSCSLRSLQHVFALDVGSGAGIVGFALQERGEHVTHFLHGALQRLEDLGDDVWGTTKLGWTGLVPPESVDKDLLAQFPTQNEQKKMYWADPIHTALVMVYGQTGTGWNIHFFGGRGAR